MLSEQRGGELSSAEYIHAPKLYLKCFTLSSSCWRRHSEGNLQYFFLRCLIVKTSHFLSLPICQSPIKRWIHSSTFWKSYWLLRIMNEKRKQKESWELGGVVSWEFTSEAQRLLEIFWLNNIVYITNRFRTPWNHKDLGDFRNFSFNHYSVQIYSNATGFIPSTLAAYGWVGTVTVQKQELVTAAYLEPPGEIICDTLL